MASSSCPRMSCIDCPPHLPLFPAFPLAVSFFLFVRCLPYSVGMFRSYVRPCTSCNNVAWSRKYGVAAGIDVTFTGNVVTSTGTLVHEADCPGHSKALVSSRIPSFLLPVSSDVPSRACRVLHTSCGRYFPPFSVFRHFT